MECIYCGITIDGRDGDAPIPSTEQGWAEEAKLHDVGCEWVNTRAHTLQLRHDTFAVLIQGTTGRPIKTTMLPAGTCYSSEPSDAPVTAVTCILVDGYRYQVAASSSLSA